MRWITNSRNFTKKPRTVGTIHSPGSLRVAQRIRAGEVDFLEIRVDHFAPDTGPLLRALPRLHVPLIVTVRHPAEGGAHALGWAQRRELFARFLPFAALIDVELRSMERLASTVTEARRAGVKVIASTHHFRSTPTDAAIRQLIARAHAAGADVCKLAALAATPTALGCLLASLARPQPLPLSVMGMGAFGKVSRLVLAQAGSVLNYGYLDRPNASGQWEARLLKQRLAELAEY